MHAHFKRRLLVTLLVALAASSAHAATYTLKIDGGEGILKVFVRGGSAHYLRSEGQTSIYEVKTDDNNCVHHLGLLFTSGNSLATEYDLCAAPPLGIVSKRSR